MRIGVFNNSLPKDVGGAARFESEITRALFACESTEYEFLTVSSQPDSEINGVTHITLPAQRRIGKWESRMRRLLRIPASTGPDATQVLRKSGIDLVYSPSPFIPVIGLPYIVTCWDLQHRIQPFFPEVSVLGWKWESREQHYRTRLPKASMTIVGTQVGKSQVERFYGIDPNRIAVVPFPASGELLKVPPTRPEWAPQQPFVLYPAQFWPHKNHITLLKAIKDISEKGRQVSVVFSGGDFSSEAGTREYLQSLSVELGLNDRVVFPGFISDAELRWAYENALALVYPSLFGPDNLPPLEAFLLQCPVIASDIVGASEQLDDAAILVDACNETDFANAIIHLADSQSTRNKLIQRGQQIVQGLTVEQYVHRIISVLDELSLYFRCWRQ